MARTKLKLNSRVKAATIIEVVVAMVVIVLVFGVAMTIFSNVLRVSTSVKKEKAQAELQQALTIIEQTGSSAAQTFIKDDFTIEEESKSYGQNGLMLVSLTAFDVNKDKVASLQKVIPAHD